MLGMLAGHVGDVENDADDVENDADDVDGRVKYVHFARTPFSAFLRKLPRAPRDLCLSEQDGKKKQTLTDEEVWELEDKLNKLKESLKGNPGLWHAFILSC